jgi:hypothetical protein
VCRFEHWIDVGGSGALWRIDVEVEFPQFFRTRQAAEQFSGERSRLSSQHGELGLLCKTSGVYGHLT